MTTPLDGALKIYYCAPVSGGGFPREHYAAQVAYLKRFGRVLTEHLASAAALGAHDAALGPAATYDADMARIRDADVIVADVTFASTGTGLALGVAVSLGKKILATYDPSAGRASSLVVGCSGLLARPYSSAAEWQALCRFFLPPARVFLFGAPGSGKGTLAAGLCARLGLVHISTGDLLRAYRREKAGTDDALAATLAGFMDRGALVPAAVMSAIVLAKLSEPAVRARGFVLDGYPPSLADAESLASLGVFPTAVLVLRCAPELAVARQVARHERRSDQPALAAERVRTYDDATRPVLGTLPAELVAEIDASAPVEAVRAAAEAALLDTLFRGRALQWALSSYVLTPGATTSPRFHSHIDAVSHAFLRDVLMRVAPTGSQVKLYPVSDLELGPQSRPGGGGAAGAAVYARAAAPFAPVYKRLANFHRIAGNPADEAFATVAMGDAGLDYAHLAACLSLASAYAHGEVLVEVEENVFEAETDVRTGAQSVTLDAGETPYAVDWAQLPAGAQARAMPSAERPRFELHHGFDVTKSSEDEAGPPIGLDAVMTASAELAGMAVGGWFIFAKRGVWAYRCNEFSNESYSDCVGRLRTQAAALHSWVVRTPGMEGRALVAMTLSLEKVLAMWPAPVQ